MNYIYIYIYILLRFHHYSSARTRISSSSSRSVYTCSTNTTTTTVNEFQEEVIRIVKVLNTRTFHEIDGYLSQYNYSQIYGRNTLQNY